jgi:molecular chaperone HscA
MNLLQIYEPGQTPLPHQDAVAMGIDLGTTHSVVAICSDDGTEVVQNIHGHALVPSIVYYGANGIEVGYPAKKRYEEGQKGAIASIKRLMGRSASDIKSIGGNLPYEFALSDGMAKVKAGGREVTPVEVSAEILKHLKHMAEQALGREVTQAVITVPAYFDDAARMATKDAGKLAGLEVLRLLNEPTAAALAYGLDKGAEGIYAVYDLGGGTFDISLLKLEQGVFQVLATGGDTQLGGDDFDQAIAAWMLAELGFDEKTLKPEEVGALVAIARNAKHSLSERQEVTISYNNKSVTLTREDFDGLIYPYIEKARTICEQALTDAKLSTVDIKGVVMVGGSTRVPLVLKEVGEFFGKPPLTDVNPDEVVAIGAAIQARGLTHGAEHLLLDVIPLSLGLETMGGLTEKIIERNTPIPVSAHQEFTTGKDGQTAMSVHVVQGEREMVAHNRSLAKFELTGIPPLPVGIARIKVTFIVDADGLLTVSAEEKTTGAKQSVTVQPAYGIAPEDMERMLRESMEQAKTDITERLLVETRMEAERTIIELESAMKQDGNLLEAAERKRFELQIQVVKNAAEGQDREYIDAEVQELARMVGPFAERRMDKAIASALKGTHIDKAGNA